jgi:hypothetical protein
MRQAFLECFNRFLMQKGGHAVRIESKSLTAKGKLARSEYEVKCHVFSKRGTLFGAQSWSLAMSRLFRKKYNWVRSG